MQRQWPRKDQPVRNETNLKIDAVPEDTHKNQGCVEVSTVFFLEFFVMFICKLHIGCPECTLFISDRDLWFQCFDCLLDS